ncbi:hypothetical protein KL86CLO1_11202 [uncultured Eubacteriales bacterium]|uniref:Uncharacterized protein n=1 Tax=uncultured Eubacteriales bacterium TaxID=172733 RepID=A0A212JJ71_9FIRM|nr:hypothetical protein KL86CLO1_11202 [uncultured Eubacteriales bacterium]
MTVEERVAALKGQSVLKTLSQPTSVAGRVAALKQQEQSAPVTPVTVTPTAAPVAAKAETPKFTLPEPTYKAARSSMGDSAAAGGVTTPTTAFSALTSTSPSLLPSVKMDQAVEQKQLRDSAKEIARLLSYDVDAAEKEIEALRMNMTSAKMQNRGTAGSGTHGTFQAGTQRIDTTDTQNRIDELQRDVAKAKTAQAQARYSALPNASDFSSYAGKGAAIKNPSVQEAERAGEFRACLPQPCL